MMQHSALIAALILQRPLCLDCISAKAGLSTAEVDGYLHVIGRALELRRIEDRCRACGENATVFSFSSATN